jgi:hypothetical protein
MNRLQETAEVRQFIATRALQTAVGAAARRPTCVDTLSLD